jgi:large subunit ribosomal protein L10
MPKTKDQKRVIIDEITDKLKRSKSIIFTTFSKLGVKENEMLRSALRKEGGEYYVAKKTLLMLAAEKLDLKGFNLKDCKQNISAVFGYEDELAPAKTIDKFKKSNPDKVEFYGGFLDGRYINNIEVQELAKLPSKPELLARLVGAVNSPVSGLVNGLAGNLRNFVGVLRSISEKGNH